jgi:tetratricopeptide (TPR) repeat protein
MVLRLAGPAVAAVLLLTGIASAQPTEEPSAEVAPEVEQARAHFQRGAAFYKEGNFDAALAEFNRAFLVLPNYRVLYNIGQVQVERHDYVAAQRAFEDYLRQGGADVPSERREQVERDIANLKTRISELRVTSNVPGGVLSVDGVAVGTLPLKEPLRVSAGVRRLSLSKPGYITAERVVSVAGGDQPELQLKLETLQTSPSESGKASANLSPSKGSPGAGAWISLAATGAFASGAVVFGLLADEQNDKLDDALAHYPAEPSRVDDARSRLKLYAGLTDGFAAAAGVSAVLTTYFFFFASPSPPGSSEAPRKATTRVVPHASGVAVFGEF